MAEMAASIAGRRRVRDAHLHLTLVFLGATDSARLAAYEAALADVSVPILDLILDRCGYWPRPRILWLGCSRSSLELDNLVANLRQRLCGCGFTPERQPFQAHITSVSYTHLDVYKRQPWVFSSSMILTPELRFTSLAEGQNCHVSDPDGLPLPPSLPSAGCGQPR